MSKTVKKLKDADLREAIYQEALAHDPSMVGVTDDPEKFAEHVKQTQARKLKKLREHLEVFSDAIIAIIVTIMVLELPVPHDMTRYTSEFLGNIAIYAVGFVIIANFWLSRHEIFSETETISYRILLVDLVFTFLLSLIPLFTKWMMEDATSFAVFNYGIVLFLTVLSQHVERIMVDSHRYRDSPLMRQLIKRMTIIREVMSSILFIAIITIATIWPEYGHYLYVLIPILSFLANVFEGEQRYVQDHTKRMTEGFKHFEHGGH
jgi:uncharacterized membrane protein